MYAVAIEASVARYHSYLYDRLYSRVDSGGSFLAVTFARVIFGDHFYVELTDGFLVAQYYDM